MSNAQMESGGFGELDKVQRSYLTVLQIKFESLSIRSQEQD